MLYHLGLALALVVVGLADSGGAAHAARGNQGLQGGWAVDDGGNVALPASPLVTAPLMRAAGATWVRVNFRLGGCFQDWTSVGCNGKTALSTYDEVIDGVRAQKLQVLGVLSNEAWHGTEEQWKAGNAEHGLGSGDNDYVRAFARDAAVPVARYFAKRVVAWEIWNEPNAWTGTDGRGHYYGGTFLYPSNFAWLLRHVYEGWRLNGVTGVQLISGGVFGHDIGGVTSTIFTPSGPVTITKYGSFRAPLPENADQPNAETEEIQPAVAAGESGASYIRATYQYGRAKAGWDVIKRKYRTYPLDGIGQHLYVDQGSYTTTGEIQSYLDEVRAAYVAFEGGSTTKKIHMTEYGWTTTPGTTMTDAMQAENLRRSYNTFRANSYVARAYWNAIQDVPAGNLYYGLLRADGAYKPSYAAYQETAVY